MTWEGGGEGRRRQGEAGCVCARGGHGGTREGGYIAMEGPATGARRLRAGSAARHGAPRSPTRCGRGSCP